MLTSIYQQMCSNVILRWPFQRKASYWLPLNHATIYNGYCNQSVISKERKDAPRLTQCENSSNVSQISEFGNHWLQNNLLMSKYIINVAEIKHSQITSTAKSSSKKPSGRWYILNDKMVRFVWNDEINELLIKKSRHLWYHFSLLLPFWKLINVPNLIFIYAVTMKLRN